MSDVIRMVRQICEANDWPPLDQATSAALRAALEPHDRPTIASTNRSHREAARTACRPYEPAELIAALDALIERPAGTPWHTPDCQCEGTGWIDQRGVASVMADGVEIDLDCTERCDGNNGRPITGDQWAAWQQRQIGGQEPQTEHERLTSKAPRWAEIRKQLEDA